MNNSILPFSPTLTPYVRPYLQLLIKLKKNMKSRLLSVFDQVLPRKRALVETINEQLNNICQIEHARHRSAAIFLVNVMAALIDYTFKENLPSLNIRGKGLESLPALAWVCRTHVTYSSSQSRVMSHQSASPRQGPKRE